MLLAVAVQYRLTATRGRDPADGIVLASADVGRVRIATTHTTTAPFEVLLTSVLTWAAQTAILMIPTLLAALLTTIFLVPPVLAWHAGAHPGSYSTRRRGEDTGDTDTRRLADV